MRHQFATLIFLCLSCSLHALTWSPVEWKTAEYKADVTAAGSYVLVEQQRDDEGDYLAQAKAWKRLRGLARQGYQGLVEARDFLEQRQRVYDSFGLPIPDSVHAYARYKILFKWAGRPQGFPQLACYADYLKLVQEDAELFSERSAALLRLACGRATQAPVSAAGGVSARVSLRPQTQCSLIEALDLLEDDADAALHSVAVWFGDTEGGFARCLLHHLRRIAPKAWQDSWQPQWQLVGSRQAQTALPGADVDIVAVLNPRPEDAVSFAWGEDGEPSNMHLHGLKLSSPRIIRIWEAFWRALASQEAVEHPTDHYRTEHERESKYRRARATLKMGASSADIIPALRCVDGSYLFLGLNGERGVLSYCNGPRAARVLEPYMEWEAFPALVKCLKFLFASEWNPQHPKIGGAACEALAVGVALDCGRSAWEEADFKELLHASLDRLLWHLDTGERLAPLNQPGEDLLRYRDDQDMLAALKAVVERFKGYSHAELCSRLVTFVEQGLGQRRSGARAAQRLSFTDGALYLGTELLTGDHAGIYVTDFDGRFYYQEGVNSKHKILAGELSVACAGELGIEAGQLAWLSAQSGNFRPSRSQFLRALGQLALQRGDLTGLQARTLVAPGDDELMPRPIRAFYDAQDFLDTGGQTLPVQLEAGWTPLHLAVCLDQWSLLGLLEENLDPSACTDAGWTPLAIAQRYGRSRWIEHFSQLEP